MIMRALWWLLKISARASARLRAALGPPPVGTHPTEWMVGMGRLDPDEPAPSANLQDFLDTASPEDRAWLLERTAIYARTFCGRCGAGPNSPRRRCAACLELLTRVMREQHGDEARKLEQIAELARKGGGL